MSCISGIMPRRSSLNASYLLMNSFIKSLKSSPNLSRIPRISPNGPALNEIPSTDIPPNPSVRAASSCAIKSSPFAIKSSRFKSTAIEGKSGVNRSGQVMDIIGLRVKSRSGANSIVAVTGIEMSITPTFCHRAFSFKAIKALEISLK